MTACIRATSSERPLESGLGGGNGATAPHEPFPQLRGGSNSPVLRSNSPVLRCGPTPLYKRALKGQSVTHCVGHGDVPACVLLGCWVGNAWMGHACAMHARTGVSTRVDAATVDVKVELETAV